MLCHDDVQSTEWLCEKLLEQPGSTDTLDEVHLGKRLVCIEQILYLAVQSVYPSISRFVFVFVILLQPRELRQSQATQAFTQQPKSVIMPFSSSQPLFAGVDLGANHTPVPIIVALGPILILLLSLSRVFH